MTYPFRLDGKIALVTGGGSGIGEGVAVGFAQQGARVIVADINPATGQAVSQSIGDSAVFIALDVRAQTSWESLMTEVIRCFGGLDVLVNNAGVGAGGGIERETLAEHHRVLDVNVTGVWMGIRAALPIMDVRGGGSIINISSIDGLVGVEGLGSYVASKFAVTGLTRSLALELGVRNIRVNSIHPGIIDTPMVRAGPPASHDRLEKAIQRQPIRRKGTPRDIANAAIFFASDESAYCTGASLVVDGGHIAGPYRDPLHI